MIACKLYDADGHDKDIDCPEKLPGLNRDQLFWAKVTAPTEAEIQQLQRLFDLDRESIDEIARSDRRLALNNYEAYFHLDVLAIPNHVPKDGHRLTPPSVSRLDIISGENWIVTVTPEEFAFLDDFADQFRGETSIGTLSSPAFAAAILDWHLTEFLEALEAVEEFVDKLDTLLLKGDLPDESFLGQLQEGRRYISVLRRGLSPQRAVFYGISRPDFARTAKASDHFDALERRYERAIDAIEHSRELVQGTFDLFDALVSSTTNKLIRRLTFLSIMLAVIGAVAGIFGMNFETPYTATGLAGFWMVIGALIGLAATATVVGRWRKWI